MEYIYFTAFFLLVIHIKIDFCLFKDSFCDHAARLPRSP